MSYSYKEAVCNDVREWIEDHKEELQDVDRSDAYDIVCDSCWIDDSVTGNLSGSYTFNRFEARRNFFEDDYSEDYISEMIEEGIMSADTLGKKIAESDWEYIDVSIRCWLLSDAVSEVLDDVYGLV